MMGSMMVPLLRRDTRTPVSCGAQAAVLILAVCTLSACSTLNPREHDDIRLATEAEVASCQSLGLTAVKVWAGVGPVARVPEAVEDNLLVEGRRQAARMGGNTVVRGASAELGQRTFGVYRCP